MDPEFQRALIIVLVGGTIIVAVATIALFFIFRAYGGTRPGRTSHMVLIAALVAFVFLCCALLLVVSYREL